MEIASAHDAAPIMTYWEITRACGLACRHCRAAALPERNPAELSTEEGKALLGALARFGERPTHVVFTGGDPLQREDLFELVEHAVGLGLPASVTPSATALCTRDAIERLVAARATSLAFSLDGSTAERHDGIRRIPGTYERTIEAIGWALSAGASVQVNSLVAAENADDIEAIYQRVIELGVQRWALFFLISVGRGHALHEVSADESERLLEWVYERAKSPKPVIKTTEAHHFRRIAAQRRGEAAPAGGSAQSIRRGWGVRDGSGIMFISHTGDVYPSGFLEIPAGNVRLDDPVEIYRNSPLFQQLRDPDQLKGKCGACEFRMICGGSRARAYAWTGDPLESDPLCAYVPRSIATVAVGAE